MKPNPTDIVNVIVIERPNKIYAIVNNYCHEARWKTVNPGEVGVVNVAHGSNSGLLNAAMYAWEGLSPFRLTFEQLIHRSSGCGAWNDGEYDGTEDADKFCDR